MKRIGNLYQSIISVENLWLADEKARKNKTGQFGIILHDRNREANILHLNQMLQTKTYATSTYKTFVIQENKERIIHRLPYYPDRIVHHAVMNVLENIFVKTFSKWTYSCIKKRGIHAAANAVKLALRDEPNSIYCLKIDVKKFYPSIDHDILKILVRKKIKDNDLLWLLDGIIDSADGLPIGNYLSQYLANFYLTYFDHWIKQELRVRNYFRYADDIVILHANKQYLHKILFELRTYLSNNLKLQVKDNYQIFPVAKRGIDFVGYRFYHTHTLLRKSIKKNMARKLAKNPSQQTMAAYYGWAKHCNSINLLNKLKMNHFKDLNIEEPEEGLIGDKIKISKVLNREIKIQKYLIRDSKINPEKGSKCLWLQFTLNDNQHVLFTGSTGLINTIQKIPQDKFPIVTTIIEENERYKFT